MNVESDKKTKIALIQMPSSKGSISKNLEMTLKFVLQAKNNQSDMVVFPEMSLTGYFTEEKYISSCVDMNSQPVRTIVDASKDIAILFGIGEEENGKYYITQIFAKGGKIVGIYRKHNIQSGEENFFSTGTELPIFEAKGIKFGVTICADIDFVDLYRNYATRGCRLVFECASPDLYGDRENRNWEKGYLWWKNNCIEKIGTYSKENNIHIAVVTQSGRNEEDDFPGGGYLFSQEGKIIAETKDHEQEVLFCEV